MKSIFQSACIVLLSFFIVCQAVADQETVGDSHLSKSSLKLFSGLANIATGWLEVPKNMKLVDQQPVTIASGVTAIGQGIFQGTWYTINRIGCGTFDLLTFMFPTKPSVDPAFVWEDFSRESQFGKY